MTLALASFQCCRGAEHVNAQKVRLRRGVNLGHPTAAVRVNRLLPRLNQQRKYGHEKHIEPLASHQGVGFPEISLTS